MREEIFGPILPIVDGAPASTRPSPSSTTGTSRWRCTRSPTPTRPGDRLAAETSSGGLGFGLPLAHLTVSDLPFGGVGESGMGSYHGRYSIETFSHRKAVLDKPLGQGK